MNNKTSPTLDDYTLFRLLCELEAEPACSQRELARRLDSALGLVNGYLKTAADKGWVRVKELSSHRCTYHLTTKGAAELKQLSLKQARYLARLIPTIQDEYRLISRQLQDEGIDRVALCGVDGVTALAWLALHEAGIEVVVVMDARKIGSNFMGKEVVSLAHAMLSGMYRVVISTCSRADVLHQALLDLGAEASSIKVPAIFLENNHAA